MVMNLLKRLFSVEKVKEDEPLSPPDSIVTDILKWVESVDPTVDDDYICEKEEKQEWDSIMKRYKRTVSYEFYDKSNKGFRIQYVYNGIGRKSKLNSYFRLVTIFKSDDGDFTNRTFVSCDKIFELNLNSGNEPIFEKIHYRLMKLYPQSRSYKLEKEEETKRKVLENKVDGEIFDLFSNIS